MEARRDDGSQAGSAGQGQGQGTAAHRHRAFHRGAAARRPAARYRRRRAERAHEPQGRPAGVPGIDDAAAHPTGDAAAQGTGTAPAVGQWPRWCVIALLLALLAAIMISGPLWWLLGVPLPG
jgi:hypothetical protein